MKNLLRLLLALSFVACVFAQDVPHHGGGGGRSSEFEPEKEDDTLFVVDEAPHLDTFCTYRSGGPLRINLPIRRYVGDVDANGKLKDVNALIAAKVISAKATLRLPVYDVDTIGIPDDPSVPPEVDVISINDKRLGVLSGVTDVWKINEFTIDVRDLKFPSRGGPPAENVIEIRIDTANEGSGREAWCTAVDWLELRFEAIAPVFLVHGLGGGMATWVPTYTEPLTAAKIPHASVVLDGLGATKWNGFLLGRQLHQLAEELGAKKCHIIAHSKGGLDTRSFLNNAYDPERLKVLSVYTLSTPHRGTPVADLGLILAAVISPGSQVFRLLNTIAPAFQDLTTVKVALFNLFNSRIPAGTAFYSIGGDADLNHNRGIDSREAVDLGMHPLLATLLYNFIGQGERAVVDIAWPTEWGERIINGVEIVELTPFVGNDVLVSHLSARHGNYLGTLPANHATIKQSTSAIVIDGIQQGAPVGARVLAAIDPPGVTTTAVIRDSFRLTPAGRSRTYNVTVDSTPFASLFVVAASRTLTVTMTAPGGAIHNAELIPLENEGTLGAAYAVNVTNPVPGSWSVTVTEPGTLTSLDVVASVFLSNNVQSALVGGDEPYPHGSKIRLALVVFDGTRRLNGLTVVALLQKPDDAAFAPVPVTFRDDGTDADTTAGDGIYQAFVTPPAPGDYAMRVEALGTASTGAFRRSSAADLRVVERTAAILDFDEYGVDDNFDGLDDRIIVRPYADLETAGTYEVFVRLRASNGKDIQRAVEATLPAGFAYVDVPFPAEEFINELGVDGPYTIVEVRFSRVAGEDVVPADVRYYLGATYAYDLEDLQHRRIRLTGTGTARGVNTTGDPRKEYLEVELQVVAEESGTYDWSVALHDRNGREISFIAGDADFIEGTNKLVLHFPGEDIVRNAVHGPWFVKNLAMYGSAGSLVVNDVLTTPPFRATDFGAPARRRTARH